MTQEQQILLQLNRISESLAKIESGCDPALLPSVMAIVGIVIGAFVYYLLGIKSQKQLHNYQKQHESFGELMGLKFLLAQLYVSRFEALIYSDYHEARWKYAGFPSESIDVKETQRWMHKSEDLVLEIAKINKQLFNSLGIISAVFPRSPELTSMVDVIYNFKTPKLTVNAADLKLEALDEWKIKAVAGVQKVIDSEISEPINKLLSLLHEHFSNEQLPEI